MERYKSTNRVAIIASSEQEVRRAISATLAIRATGVSTKEVAEELVNMKPSPTMQVRFPNGEVVMMNRAERRRNHLYRDRLTKGRRPRLSIGGRR